MPAQPESRQRAAVPAPLAELRKPVKAAPPRAVAGLAELPVPVVLAQRASPAAAANPALRIPPNATNQRCVAPETSKRVRRSAKADTGYTTSLKPLRIVRRFAIPAFARSARMATSAVRFARKVTQLAALTNHKSA